MAFVQNNNGVASLVILKSQRNPVSEDASLVVLSNSDPSLYRTCAAPCMTELALQGQASVTFSAPFYDYADDVLYLGDDIGQLHKFQNIFGSGTPSEITGGDNDSGWPQNIAEAVPAGGPNALTSPVYDSVTGNVFVAIVATYNAAAGLTAYIPSTGAALTSSTPVRSPTLWAWDLSTARWLIPQPPWSTTLPMSTTPSARTLVSSSKPPPSLCSIMGWNNNLGLGVLSSRKLPMTAHLTTRITAVPTPATLPEIFMPLGAILRDSISPLFTRCQSPAMLCKCPSKAQC